MTSQTSPNSKVLWVNEMPWQRRTNPGLQVQNTCVYFLAHIYWLCDFWRQLLNLSEPRFLIWKPEAMPNTKSLSGRWNNKVLFRHGTGCQTKSRCQGLLVLIHTSFWLGQNVGHIWILPLSSLPGPYFRKTKKEGNKKWLAEALLKASPMYWNIFQSKTRLLIIHCYWNRK